MTLGDVTLNRKENHLTLLLRNRGIRFVFFFFFLLFLLFYFVVFFKTSFLCSPGYPGIHSVVLAGLELGDLLGLKTWATISG